MPVGTGDYIVATYMHSHERAGTRRLGIRVEETRRQLTTGM